MKKIKIENKTRKTTGKEIKTRNARKTVRKIKTYGTAIALLFCTSVGSYGIFTAPESDQSELARELLRNEQALEQMDSTAWGMTKGNGSKGSTSTEEKTITVIGDSVFLGAAPAFHKIQKNVVIDAKISRQVCQALDVAKKLDKKGKLGNTVIIALGTNGRFNPATGQALIDYLGTGRKIYWVNVYGKDISWQKSVNKTIKNLAKKNKNVYPIAWSTLGAKHPDWFYQDGTHLNTKGQTGFAKFIKKKIK